ncbi:MAG: deoxynucleoside kinase [Bacteroidetes bacterium]|nr:deoxynucleoside kinase [Bacteroidota bacterium]
MNNLRYIAIEGVIGAGKTRLAQILSTQLNAKLVLEKFDENPFLERFYADQKRYAFQTQLFFTLSRFKQQQEISQIDLFQQSVISDYIFDKDKIFAYLNLQNDELALYETLITSLEKKIQPPDLVVYLQSNVSRLMKNIQTRGRSFESQISEKYISELSEAYNYYFFRYKAAPLLVVNSSEIDFVNNRKDLKLLIDKITTPRRSPVEYFNPEK